ncbi:type II toxin-antitoxin system HigA family antitoxin [Thermodesulfobacteriota bacterium]
MINKPIRTEEDYEAACKRVDEIFQAEEGTLENDELEVLLTLVDKYEEERFPIGMPHPIEAIRIQMENLDMPRNHLMERLGKRSGRISDILNCRRRLTLNDVRNFSKLLRIPIEVLSQAYPLEKPKRTQAQSVGKGAATC